MKVKDFTNSYWKPPTQNIKFVVKPKGDIKYFDSENQQLNFDIGEMIINNWFIPEPYNKKQLTIVIIVEKNEEFETKRRKNFEKLIGKKL